MKKKVVLLAIFVCSLAALLAVSAFAADIVESGNCGKYGDNVTYTLDSDGLLTISGKGEMEDYCYYVENFKYSPWQNKRGEIKAVVIDKGVTSIGNWTFCGCSNLASIEIPSGVTSIGDHALCDCSSLTSIVIPQGVTSINNYMFSGCSSLENVEIPNSVTSIGNQAFRKCNNLASIEIPSSVTNIGNWAFGECNNLTKIEMSNGVTSIGYHAFCDCSSLTNIEIPNSVTSIGDSAFLRCNRLTNIKIPSNVTSIGSGAFSGCDSLIDIEISNGVASINSYAFRDCNSLTSIEIPSSITSIGAGAFYGCGSLAKIVVSEDNQNYSSDEQGVLFNKNKTTLICCPGGFTDTYRIPSSVTSIGFLSFAECSNLLSIEMPNNVTNIEIGAFIGCCNLTSIEIPSSVKAIGTRAFYNCEMITDVYYGGTESEWANISIKDENDCLLGATIHYSTPTVKGVTIMAIEDTNINDKTVLVVENVASEDLPQTAKEAIGEKKHIAYDITLENSGAKVQPSGKVRVELTPPDSYNLENCIVYHIKEDGTLENMNAVIKNGRLCFETDHFSVYMIIDTSEYTMGDTDGDGTISAADAVLLAQHLAGWETKINLSAADVNGDGEVNAKDSVLLAQYLAGWDIKLGK